MARTGLRIIGGTARSLPLRTIAGQDTRPTTDKIKETLFNMIGPDMPGCTFLDLFAGSGQIGLEAISRGAAYAVFVERSRKAAACIQQNIDFTKFGEQCRLMITDVQTALVQLAGRMRFDVIFMDPPYNQGLEKDVLATIARLPLLAEDGYIVVEASLETDFSYLEEMGLELYKYKKYRTNCHAYIRPIRRESL